MEKKVKNGQPALEQSEEKILLEKLSKGDSDAYKTLYTLYLPFIHQYIGRYLDYHREDIEEVSQEVFLNIWRRRDSMVLVRSFENYLFIATRNTLSNFISQRATRITRQAQAAKTIPILSYSTEEKMLENEYHVIAKKALELLSDKRRLIFNLYTQEELSIQAIADHLSMSTSGVHESLQKAMQFIKEYLRDHGIEVSIFLIMADFF